LRHLGEVKDGLPSELVPLAETMFAAASETLISSTLEEIPADGRVFPAVRELVADHSRDEKVHRSYFLKALRLLWPQLTDGERAAAGGLLARFMVEFLGTDREAEATILVAAGLDEPDARRVVKESYSPQAELASTRQATTWAIRQFERIGLFDHPQVLSAFGQAGLLGPR
jgi:hypothetical protein